MTNYAFDALPFTARPAGLGPLGRLAAGLRRWFLYRRTLAELSALSDRMLADMGIQRADIDRIARKAAGLA